MEPRRDGKRPHPHAGVRDGYAVFDIEYVNKSPRGLDAFVLRQDVPDAFNQEFSQIQTSIQQLFDAIRSGTIQLKDAPRYVSELQGLTDQGKLKLLDTVKSVERDNDAYLGQAARFFGSAFFTGERPRFARMKMQTQSSNNTPRKTWL